jgi:hypothetical protein
MALFRVESLKLSSTLSCLVQLIAIHCPKDIICLFLDKHSVAVIVDNIRGPMIHGEPHVLFTKEEEGLMIQRIRSNLQICE